MKLDFREIIKLPNLISLFRLLLLIPCTILFQNISKNDSNRYYLLILCLTAFISDLLDGFIARKTNQVSEFGKIIDPLADKILVGIIILNLFLIHQIPAYYLVIILLRDVLILLGGIFVTNKLGKVLPSNMLGKITVLSIGLFILIIILQINPKSSVYKIFLFVSIILCIASLAGYLLRAIELIRWNKDETIQQN
jgi:CDP-diacylglycerol--glycerol-3-phosphate 3-phosphatidyltransferase